MLRYVRSVLDGICTVKEVVVSVVIDHNDQECDSFSRDPFIDVENVFLR